MATGSSDKPANAGGLSRLRHMAIIAGGVAVAFAWVVFAQKLGDTITIASAGGAMTVYFGLLFLPLIALALLLGLVEQRRVVQAGVSPWRWAAIGAGLGAGGLLTTVAYAALNGGVVRGQGGWLGFGLLALGLGLMAVQVFAEEVFFRGWLLPALAGRIGAPGGVVLGAGLFAALHVTAGVRAPLSLLNLMLGGVWFGLLAWRSGGLAAPFAAHFAWNALEDQGLGLTPNPGAGALGSVFDFDLTGLPLWGGQEEGLNASIGTTLVLIALIVPLVRRGVATARPGTA